MKKCLEIISLITCLLMILGTIIGSALISYGEIGLNIFSYFLTIMGGINLVLYILSKIKNFHFSIYEYFIFLLIILAGLSMINAISSEVALYGNEGRNEGLLVILSSYLRHPSYSSMESVRHLLVRQDSLQLCISLWCHLSVLFLRRR